MDNVRDTSLVTAVNQLFRGSP